MKNVALTIGVLGLSVCGAGRAMAGTLLDLVNPTTQSDTPYSLSFIAGAATTDIQFEGYQLPAFLFAADISLTNGGGNLLGTTWTFTPAPSGSDSYQYDDGDGTGTNALAFGGVTGGSFDQYDQLVGTVAGQTYTLDFQFTNDIFNEPSEMAVSASGASVTAPEPSSMFLIGSGLLGVMIGACKRRKIS